MMIVQNFRGFEPQIFKFSKLEHINCEIHTGGFVKVAIK
jgi:hypothetical protein